MMMFPVMVMVPVVFVNVQVVDQEEEAVTFSTPLLSPPSLTALPTTILSPPSDVSPETITIIQQPPPPPPTSRRRHTDDGARRGRGKRIMRSFSAVFPELGFFSLQGVGEYSDLFKRMPDLKMTFLKCTSEKGNNFSYTISGTQTDFFLPMFPVGKWVEWKFTSRWDPKIRVHDICFDLPLQAEAEHYEALAQCFEMLVSTAGGSRLLQRALEVDTPRQENKELLLDAMRGKVWMMSMSPHGNHVVQKCIATFLPHKLQFIINTFKERVVKASCDRMQSRVVERLIEYCPPQQMTLLLKEALDHAPQLLTHTYGNFVMQSLLVHGADEHRSTLVTKMSLEILRFSRNKISKIVVCKAMWYSSMADKLSLFNAICVNLTNLGGHKKGKMVIEEMRCILQYLLSK
jgi:hypothetical protein